jgi:hypothetical protein
MFHSQIEENSTAFSEPGRAADSAGHEDSGGAAWLAAVGGGPDAILDRINKKLPHEANPEEAMARKCNCMSVWCKECYRRFHLPRHFKRLSEIPWDECRFVTLTLDPKKTGLGPDAFNFFRENKILGRFIQDLERAGVEVFDWCGQMEFHVNGNPHFHLVVKTGKGSKGKIGNAKLLKAWKHGLVREEYFKSHRDYERLVGYFGKTGYFHKNKEHQTVLPDYFQSEYYRGKRIQRFFSARKPRAKERRIETITREIKKPSKSLTWKSIQKCGKQTILFYFKKDGVFDDFKEKYLQIIDIPYSWFKRMFLGRYVEGRGFIFSLTGTEPETPPCPF